MPNKLKGNTKGGSMDKFARAVSRTDACSSPSLPEESGVEAHAGTSGPDLTVIMESMAKNFASFHEKLDDINANVASLKTRVDQAGTRITEAESRISTNEDEIHILQSTVAALSRDMKAVKSKCDDLESRSRRNNLRIIGVPENALKGRMEDAIESLLKDLLDNPALSPHFTVERAHRALSPRPKPGDIPRPIIARILNYRDRDLILRLAREKGELRLEANTVRIFPDFSVAVQQERRQFLGVKKLLRERNVPYAILFPARLKLTHNGKLYFFTVPEEAVKFIESEIPLHNPRNDPAAAM